MRIMNQISLIWMIYICRANSNKRDLEAAVQNVLTDLLDADYDFWVQREASNTTTEETVQLYHKRYIIN